MSKEITRIINNASQMTASYIAHETIRREYASDLCGILARLQVTAVQLFCSIGGDEEESILKAEMQRCNIEIEEKLNQASPYLMKKEVVAVKMFRDRVFYNYQIWEGIESKIIRPWGIKYYPDSDQTRGVAKCMYDKAQKYLSSNGLSRAWLYVISEILILPERLK